MIGLLRTANGPGKGTLVKGMLHSEVNRNRHLKAYIPNYLQTEMPIPPSYRGNLVAKPMPYRAPALSQTSKIRAIQKLSLQAHFSEI